MEELENARRTAERGLKKAQAAESNYIDIFQHILDCLERAKKEHETIIAELESEAEERYQRE